MSTDIPIAPARRRSPRARRSGRMRALVGCGLLLLVGLVVVLGPFLAPHGTSDYVGAPFEPASSAAPLGTDHMGQDVLSRVLHGGRTVVLMAAGAAALGMVLGVLAGVVAGYARGVVDNVVMRIADIVLSLPTMVLALLLVSVFGPKLWMLVVIVGVAHAPSVARVTRAVTLDVREREFVEYAQTLGTPARTIVATEILPNIATPLMVEFGIRLVWSIAAFAGLSVLGQGVQAPAADWGLMINENRIGLAAQPLAVVAPLVLIALFAVAVNLIAESVGRSISGLDRSE